MQHNKLVLFVFLIASLLVSSTTPRISTAAKQDTFTQWLGKIKAYDVLEQELAAKPDQTPQVLLKRAQAFLELKRPKQALTVLNSQDKFADSTLEAQRLLLVSESQRYLGKQPEAVISMRNALQMVDAKSQQDFLQKASGVADMWQDVWRTWYWRYVDTPLDSAQSKVLEDDLEQTLSAATALWPGTSFWDASLLALSGFKTSRKNGWMPQVQLAQMQVSLPVLKVDAAQRLQIAKGLCAIGIGSPSLAPQITAANGTVAVRDFWQSIFKVIDTGEAGETNSTSSFSDYPIADVFAGNFDHIGLLADSGRWRVAKPDVPAWTEFIRNLIAQPITQAREKIRQELESSLITPATAQALRLYDFAFAVLEDDKAGYTETWEQLKGNPLPLAFSMAAIVLFELPPETMPSASDPDALHLMRRLAGAAGMDALGGFAPFWLECTQSSGLTLASAVQNFPLDQQLNLALIEKQWRAHKSPALAKRAGFLFSNTTVGTSSLLYLAQLAGESGSLHTTAFYLNRLDSRKLSGKVRADYLQAKAALEIDLGRNQDALKSYMELVELDGQRLAPVKRLKLALLAQQQGKMQWSEGVLKELWNDRESLEEPVQAEVLFWLAEGAGATGRLNEALEKYLQVAWQYKSQNIWAVTAMYRAAVIYERARNFDAAKVLLKAVIRNADRKSQKEAAQDRLKAVDAELNKHLKKNTSSEKTDFTFPF